MHNTRVLAKSDPRKIVPTLQKESTTGGLTQGNIQSYNLEGIFWSSNLEGIKQGLVDHFPACWEEELPPSPIGLKS